ncbi:FecR family protein [Galbibacter marinus]|uniref:FecR family protein n=1 Tax=Galbibacter marinus TaxID=555500 RepID=UPI0002D44E33|nr:FecR domain-containing protein [Galbibacter marinus]
MNREEFLALLEKYQLGKTSDGETKRIEQFFDQLQQNGPTPLLSNKKQKQLFGGIEKKLPELQRKKQRRSHIALMAMASIAACLCLLFWPSSTTFNSENLSIKTSMTQDSLKLSDGSTVYLSPYTTLIYPQQFGDNSRTVELKKGSAFFKVAHDEDRPFSVISDGITTRVLGTTFNVSKQDSSINITVASGKVMVSSKQQSLSLIANEQALFTKEIGLNKQRVNAQLYSNWMNQNMDYGSITLSELSTVMKLRFGTPFQFQDTSLKSSKVRVSILKGENVEQVISKLNYITKYNLKINSNVIKVSKSN